LSTNGAHTREDSNLKGAVANLLAKNVIQVGAKNISLIDRIFNEPKSKASWMLVDPKDLAEHHEYRALPDA
jgi:hypothetical protein